MKGVRKGSVPYKSIFPLLANKSGLLALADDHPKLTVDEVAFRDLDGHEAEIVQILRFGFDFVEELLRGRGAHGGFMKQGFNLRRMNEADLESAHMHGVAGIGGTEHLDLVGLALGDHAGETFPILELGIIVLGSDLLETDAPYPCGSVSLFDLLLASASDTHGNGRFVLQQLFESSFESFRRFAKEATFGQIAVDVARDGADDAIVSVCSNGSDEDDITFLDGSPLLLRGFKAVNDLLGQALVQDLGGGGCLKGLCELHGKASNGTCGLNAR